MAEGLVGFGIKKRSDDTYLVRLSNPLHPTLFTDNVDEARVFAVEQDAIVAAAFINQHAWQVRVVNLADE